MKSSFNINGTKRGVQKIVRRNYMCYDKRMVHTAIENEDWKVMAIAAQATYGWIWKSLHMTTITSKLQRRS